MKTIFKSVSLLLVGWLMPLCAFSQEKPPKTGFIRLVNAVAAGTGKLDVKVDGESLNPDGYDMGNVTGGVSVKPGSRKVTISREGNKPGTTTVIVNINETTILIPFAEKVPASDTEPAHFEIRVLRLKQLEPESDRSATFVSVSQTPELKVQMREPGGKWSEVTVKRLAITQAPIRYPRGYAPLKLGDEKIESITVADPGNYVVLLYDDQDGKTKSLNFRDYKFLSAD